MFGNKHLSIDESFLNYIDQKRLELAVAFYKNNPKLDAYELTEATQRTIDRIVFIKFLEDKLIETEAIIHNIATHPHPWAKFVEYTKYLDGKYNGVVFKPLFIDDKNFGGADADSFRSLCSDLDHTNSPYDFNYIPIHILGSIYERFLGKVVIIEHGKARIELKPEVRKAGGVFYTPKYIVDYIVENTVGKLTRGLNPSSIAKLSFADIACGSGSFLIGVFEYLLDYHNKYYNDNPVEAKKDGCKYNEDFGQWVLSIQQKQQILLNNIYGVDIDMQATEVTQLSLFLKMLEDETTSSTNDMQVLFHEKILPNLSNNIKCGNSLIGTDILNTKLDLDLHQERKSNPFDFKMAFPKVFGTATTRGLNPLSNNGFDAIVGNPPYVKELGSKEMFQPVLQSKLGQLYYQGKMDFWYYFVHRGIDILKENGSLGFITNSYWMKSGGASKMIDRLEKETIVDTIVDFDNYKVFKDVSGKHNITIFIKGNNPNYKCKILSINKENPDSNIDNYNLQLIENENLFENHKLNIENTTISFKNCDILDNYFRVSQGVVEATDKITKKHKANTSRADINVGDGVFVLNKKEIEKLNFNNEEIKLLKPYVNTNHILKYGINFNNEYLLYLGKEERDLILNGKYPNVKKHLDNVKEFITSSNAPYGIHRTRDNNFFESNKLICKGMFLSPEFYYDEEKYYCGFSFSVIIAKTNKYNLKVLLALMNSAVGKYWFNKNGKKRGIGVDIGVQVFREFPIPKYNKSNQDLHDQIVALVEQMLKTKAQQQAAVTERDKNYLDEKCKNLDAQINDLVYALYGLDAAAIAIIEKKN